MLPNGDGNIMTRQSSIYLYLKQLKNRYIQANRKVKTMILIVLFFIEYEILRVLLREIQHHFLQLTVHLNVKRNPIRYHLSPLTMI